MYTNAFFCAVISSCVCLLIRIPNIKSDVFLNLIKEKELLKANVRYLSIACISICGLPYDFVVLTWFSDFFCRSHKCGRFQSLFFWNSLFPKLHFLNGADQSANIALCPLALLYSCRSFMPLNHPIVFLFPNTHIPLWLLVFCGSCSLAILHFIVETEPQKTEQVPVVLVAFLMSVFWISTVAGELLNCLEALGTLLKLPPALLGLTVSMGKFSWWPSCWCCSCKSWPASHGNGWMLCLSYV